MSRWWQNVSQAHISIPTGVHYSNNHLFGEGKIRIRSTLDFLKIQTTNNFLLQGYHQLLKKQRFGRKISLTLERETSKLTDFLTENNIDCPGDG